MTSGKKLALGILLPFALLVGAGLFLTQRAVEPAAEPAPPALSAPPPLPSPLPPTRANVTQALTAALVQARKPTSPEQAVGRLVDECFRDAAAQYPPPQRVVLSFTVRGASLDEAEVKESTLTDPRLLACFLDAVGDARWEGRSVGAARITRTYAFGPVDGGA